MAKTLKKKKTTRKRPQAKQVKNKKQVKRARSAKPAQEKFEGVAKPKLTVIGIGGGGCSIISEIAPKIGQANFLAANTDSQALKAMRGPVKSFQFGQELTGGLGSGMNPRLAELAAQKEKPRIKEILQGTDLCILVACLGGGTGSGAGPVFAEIAQNVSSLTLGIFTLPFKFEGAKRAEIAKASLERIRGHLNALSIVPNENIFKVIDKTTPLEEAFSSINAILAMSLTGLVETIYRPSLINVDFADLRMLMEGRGRLAYLNSALSQGKERAGESARKVLKSPLQTYDITNAERILFNIQGGRDLKMSEVEYISQEISGLSKKAKVIFGISQTADLGQKIKITVLGIGCGRKIRPLLKPRRGEVEKQAPVEVEEKPSSLPIEVPDKVGTKAGAKSTTGKKEPDKKNPVSNKEAPASAPSGLRLGEPVKILPEAKPRVKRSALQVKKAVEQAEQEILKKEEEWESPAFLRRENR